MMSGLYRLANKGGTAEVDSFCPCSSDRTSDRGFFYCFSVTIQDASGIAQSDNLFCTHRSNKQKGDVYDVVRKN